MKIGGIELKNGIFLAPMAGVTDNAMRQICREYGAEFTVTEMISAKAVNFGNKKTLRLGYIAESENPCALQIFGNEPQSMAEAAKRLCENLSLSVIDINMGCPVPKISGSGDGAALMRDPILAGKIMESVVQSVNLPVTVKIRAGWDSHERNAPEIAKIAENSGITAVTVHGRTRKQMYSPPVDFDIIAETVSAVKIPVIANGDIFSGADALHMKNRTSCAGIMVGRGALGNPWIFSEIDAAFNGTTYIPPTPDEKYSLIKRHLDLMIFYKTDKIASTEARKHLSWYIKGYPSSASAREKINHSSSSADLLSIVASCLFG